MSLTASCPGGRRGRGGLRRRGDHGGLGRAGRRASGRRRAAEEAHAHAEHAERGGDRHRDQGHGLAGLGLRGGRRGDRRGGVGERAAGSRQLAPGVGGEGAAAGVERVHAGGRDHELARVDLGQVGGGHLGEGAGPAEILELRLDEALHLGAILGELLGDELADLARGQVPARGVEVLLQGVVHLLRGGVAILAAGFRGALADPGEGLGHVGRGLAKAGDLAVDEVVDDGDLGDALPHAAAGDGLPEHHPDGEDVGAPVDPVALGLLGRHVGHLALDGAGARLAAGVDRLGDAEVDDLDQAVVGDEHVLRGGVAVDHAELGAVEVAELVGVVQPGQGVGEDAHLHVGDEGRPGPRPDAVEGLPVEVLHGDEVALAVLPDLRGLHHVGVVEARRQAGLVEEHGEELRILRQLGPGLLDHHQLVEPGRALDDREVHVRHAAVANLRDQPVLAQCLGFFGSRHANLPGERGDRKGMCFPSITPIMMPIIRRPMGGPSVTIW